METIDKTIEVVENIDDTIGNGNLGYIGWVLIGGAALAAAVAGTVIIKSKETIKTKVDALREQRRIKKINRLMAKINKLENDSKETEEK